MEYIWFIEFSFLANGNLQQCRVAPLFPAKGQTIIENVLCSLKGIDECDTLIELLQSTPTPGFQLLSRYVDTLSSIHSLPLTPLQLITSDGNKLDVSGTQILAQGQHSLVLLLSSSSKFVIKISFTSLIDRERRIHSLVDKSSRYLRTMVEGAGGYGSVIGGGDGLSFILLEGVGVPFVSSHLSDSTITSLWEQSSDALSAMHRAGVLHRDVKPSNMIIIHGALVLNDFDVACELKDDQQLHNLVVGTSTFHSPKLKDMWRERDDWISLVLSFLSFRLPFPFVDKQAALESAMNLTWVPNSMKERIEKCYK
jgi:hypothetical protein